MNTPLVPPSHIPSSQPSVPQVRSRITVVCAECKRLKLKCDRRNPCGSCMKRDTVSRCIYSPAAAEKVDLHSLNNRLIQVEATLSLITSGQTPLAFQSSYPYFQTQPQASNVAVSHSVATQIPATGLHQHHHHNSAPPCSSTASISLSSEDLSSIWLDELDDTDSPPFDIKISHPLTTNAGPIKLETSTNSEYTHTHLSAVGEDPIQPFSQAMHARIALPPMSVYYATPERTSENQPASQAQASTSCIPDTNNDTPPVSRPSVTPSLVALLPSFVRARQLLRRAARIMQERPVPLPACLLSSVSDSTSGIGADTNGRNNVKGKKGKGKTNLLSLTTHWDALEFRVMCLIGKCGSSRGAPTKTTDRKEREKMGARARAIFFGGGTSPATPIVGSPLTPQSGSQTPKRDAESDYDATEHTSREPSESLPFFAVVCLLLALGTAGSNITEKEEPELHPASLIQSSIGSETASSEFFYALAQQSLGVWENNLANPSVLNMEDKEAGKAEEDEKLDYLVASLLTVGYQLYEPFANRKGKDSERRRINALNKAFSLVGKMVNMARTMGLGKERKSPVRCKDEPNERDILHGRDGKKKARTEERRKRKDDLRRLIWWDIGFYEIFISDILGHSSLLSNSPSTVQFPRCSGRSPLPIDETESGTEDPQQESNEEWSVHEIVAKYHSARCRLTRIAQAIKRKLAHPDCCCGYTLDQAAQLEGELSRFLEGLPPPLRFLFKEDGKESATVQSQHAQLSSTDEDQRSIQNSQCCELAIMAQRLIIMVYLPFLRQHSSPSSSLSAEASAADHGSSDSARNLALQPTVNAAQCIIRVSKVLLRGHASNRPLYQLLTPSFLDMYPVEKALLDAAIICTHAGTFHGTLFACRQTTECASSALEMLLGLDLDSECKNLLERIKKRFSITMYNPEPSLHGVKRKHNLIGAESRGHGAEASKSQTFSPHPITEAQLAGDRSSHHTTQNAACLTPALRNEGRDVETGQKDKKYAKKSHHYPSVGIRVRPRKDGLPPFLKRRIGSPSVPVPSPGKESRTATPGQERGMQSSAIVTPVDEQNLASLSDFVPLQQQPPPREDLASPLMTPLLDDSQYQSRPNSLSQELHLHSQSRREPTSSAVAYPSAYIEMYEQGQKLTPEGHMNPSSHSDSLEGNKNHDVSSAFNHVPQILESNPYGTSSHLSSSSTSPYVTNGSGMPLTSFGPATQSMGSSPSAYSQEPTASSTHTYYHIDPEAGYTGVCDHPESTSYATMGLDGSTAASTPIMRATSSIRVANSAYDKTSAGIYNVKVPLEELIQPHIHHHPHHMLQHPSYNADQPHVHQHHSHPLPTGQPQAWPHHDVTTDSCSPRFWTTSPSSTGEYKFIH